MVKGEAMPNSARPVADGGNLDATRLRALRSRQLWDQLPDRSALMFDRDLRLLLSEGTTLRRSGRVDAEAAADAGVTADAEIGAPLTDVLSAHAMAFVEAHCRAATSGVAADLKYPHPQMGRKIRLRTGPLTGPDGTIVGGFVVTDGVSEWAQGSTIQADLEHTRLLRGIGDALAGPRLAGADLLQNVAERASVALDSVAFLRLLSPNLDAIERDLVAHPVEQIRRNVEVAMRRSSQSFEPGTPVHDQVIRRGTLLSTIGPQEVPPESLRLVHGQIEWNAEHFVVAPVRHDGQVLGVFGVFRTDIEAPYAPGDDDLVQVLADSIGSAIAESRAGAATEKEQCELLEHLATTESRERSMLAEALHDDPLQLVVAAILRIDNLRLRTDSGQEEQLEQVADMLETAVERMRKLIVAVTPPDFELGLGVALENLAEGIFTGTPCTVSTVGLMHVALTPSTKSAAYRILREALINVRKHARARTVIIRLAQVDGLVTVSITDDGVGSLHHRGRLRSSRCQQHAKEGIRRERFAPHRQRPRSGNDRHPDAASGGGGPFRRAPPVDGVPGRRPRSHPTRRCRSAPGRGRPVRGRPGVVILRGDRVGPAAPP